MTTLPVPFSTHKFFVEIDSISVAYFTELSGLDAQIETMEWQEGGNNAFSYTLPVRAKWSNLTLKRGLADAKLWDWYYACATGTIQRRGLSIALYGYTASGDSFEAIRWTVVGALPIKWAGPSLKVNAAEVAFESIELAHQGFKRAAAGG